MEKQINNEADSVVVDSIQEVKTETYGFSNIPITPDTGNLPLNKRAVNHSDNIYDKDDLPLVVHLKGNEEFFSEFNLSADEAMEILGIKRSRLNQISGKELRVGRAKVDRYIRPIYRSVDVEEYQKWTRATASHKKSKEVITDAAKQLEGYAQELADALSKDTGVLTLNLNQSISKLNSVILENLNNVKKSNHLFNSGLRNEFSNHSLNTLKSLNKITAEIEKNSDLIANQNKSILDTKSGIVMINSTVGSNNKKLETIKDEIKTISLQIKALENSINLINSSLASQQESLSNDLISIKKSLASEISLLVLEPMNKISSDLTNLEIQTSQKISNKKKSFNRFSKMRSNRKTPKW
jgi:hypothetical protein